MGVTARSTETVVAATPIASCQAEVANRCALSVASARIREPDDPAPRSFASCAGPVRRTAAIRPGGPWRERAIAVAIEPTLAAHKVSAGLRAARQVARTALTLRVAFACAGGTSSINHRFAPFAAFAVALSCFSVSRLGSTTTAVIPACLIRPRYAGRRNVLACAPISTPQSRGWTAPLDR